MRIEPILVKSLTVGNYDSIKLSLFHTVTEDKAPRWDRLRPEEVIRRISDLESFQEITTSYLKFAAKQLLKQNRKMNNRK